MNKSMTGAVVHEWAADVDGAHEHNAAIRQQAAEIERLTNKAAMLEKSRDIWSELADLKLTERKASEARNADLLKALERYGKHDAHCPHAIDTRLMGNGDDRIRKCTCGLMAAAKGGTV